MDRLQFRTSGLNGGPATFVQSATISHAIKGDAEVAHQEFLVHDTFRHGFRQLCSELQPGHPLEKTVLNAEKNRDQLKMEMEKNIYGLHSCVRREMERKELAKTKTRLPVLGSSNLANEMLSGKLDSIDFDDYLNQPSMSPAIIDVHGSAEVHRLGWSRPV